MTANLSAELVSIGTEILLGEITDTNSVYMARALRDMGINVFYMISVGDNEQRIADVIRQSLSRSDIVITCGGLGPTIDDMTRQSIANATDRELVYKQELYDMIAERFSKFHSQMTENNKRQAYLPANSIVIENPVGTAPSFVVEIGDKAIISLPGVPREMKFLFQEKVIPYLRNRYNITEQIILAKILKTAGIGESSLDDMLGNELLQASNPTIGLAAHSGQIDIRITAKADSRNQAETMIASVEQHVFERAGQFIFGADDERLEAVFAKMLNDNNATLSISETGIDSVIYDSLVSDMQDSIIAHESHPTPEGLREQLNMPEGTSLQDLAKQAARTLYQQSNSTVSIAIVSRPEVLENEDKNAGTAVAVCTKDHLRQRVYGFGAQSENIQQFVGNWSTAIAWHMVKEIINGSTLS